MERFDKELAIVRYCAGRGCRECKLFPYVRAGEHCTGDDADIDRNYARIFGEEPTTKTAASKLEHHALICDEIKELYRKKNADYGDSFHTTFLEEGMAMSRIRLTDKLERFKRLTKSNEQNVKDESVRDTLIDLANYAIMTILEMECEQNE